MANTILFSSAFIRTVNTALDEGTKRVRINMTSSLTKEVREKMDWAEPAKPKGSGRTIDEAAKTVQLEGELSARTMTLTPSDKEMAKCAIELDISEVKSFVLATIHDGESTRRELRFQVLATGAGVLRTIEQYIDSINQAKGQCKISYVKQIEMALALEEEEQPTLIDGVRKKATSAEED